MEKNKELLESLTLADTPIPKQLLDTALDVKMTTINKYDEIIWKVRAGYLAILYSGLTFLMGTAGTETLKNSAGDTAISLSIFFLILGFSLSAFSVDYGYLRKKIRVIVIRDVLVDIAYDPNCKTEVKDKLYKLLHVAAERPLKKHFPSINKEYVQKLLWNLFWILLPIYFTTPALAAVIYIVFKVYESTKSIS